MSEKEYKPTGTVLLDMHKQCGFFINKIAELELKLESKTKELEVEKAKVEDYEKSIESILGRWKDIMSTDNAALSFNYMNRLSEVLEKHNQCTGVQESGE